MTGILIGKSRRITLDELRAASKDGTLEMQEANDAAMPEDSLSSSLSKLTLTENTLSPAVTRAALTLLAMTLAQGNCAEVVLAGRFVDLVNNCEQGVQLPTDATEFAKALVGADGKESCLLMKDGKAKGFVERVINLAKIALSLSLGKC